MTRPFDVVPVRLTPLSPIHVGCGEDYEPTGYVIDADTLFAFDPALVPRSGEQRAALMKAVKLPGDAAILALQRHFATESAAYIGAASYPVSVATGVAQLYRARVGAAAQVESRHRAVVNQLEIERTTHHPHSQRPYLPGSALKGAMRTGWLNELTRTSRAPGGSSRKAKEVEIELLGGSFDTDPFRLVNVSDSDTPQITAQVLFAVNRSKAQRFDRNGNPREKDLAVMREAILPDAPRPFAAEIRFRRVEQATGTTGKVPNERNRIRDFESLARACNAFYRARFHEEATVLRSRRLASDDWLNGFDQLLATLGPALDAGQAMLLRVGRHSGAESVTLDSHRSIRISRGRAGYSNERASTTVWLAAPTQDARSTMQPFGWLLIEQDGNRCDTTAIEQWCTSQPRPDLSEGHRRLATLRNELQTRRESLARDAEKRQQDEERRVQEEMDRERRKATRSPGGLAIDALDAQFKAYTALRPLPVSDQRFAATRQLLRRAIDGPWDASDRAELAKFVEEVVYRRVDLGGKKKELAELVRQLRDRP